MTPLVSWRSSSALAAAAFLALAACSTGNGAGGSPEQRSAREAPDDEEGSKRPAFDAGFDPDDGAGADAGRSTDAGGLCLDNDDPGGAENVAKVLPGTTDCDDNYKTVSGVVKNAVDVDFYKLSGLDKPVCFVETDFEAKTPGMQLCVFLRCKNSTVDPVSGCEEGLEATSDTGWKGCCTSGPGHATPKFDCSGIADDDSADMLIRVKADDAAACLPYQFSYRF